MRTALSGHVRFIDSKLMRSMCLTVEQSFVAGNRSKSKKRSIHSQSKLKCNRSSFGEHSTFVPVPCKQISSVRIIRSRMFYFSYLLVFLAYLNNTQSTIYICVRLLRANVQVFQRLRFSESFQQSKRHPQQTARRLCGQQRRTTNVRSVL